MGSKQKKILIPTINSESWKSLLAEPEKQWKEGFSAKAAADSWESSQGFPKEIVSAMNKIREFQDIAVKKPHVHIAGTFNLHENGGRRMLDENVI